MTNKSGMKQTIIGLAAIVIALVLLFSIFGNLKDSIIPMGLAIIICIGLPLTMMKIRGRALKIMGLVALGWATLFTPFALFILPRIGFHSGDPSGLTGAAITLLSPILLFILWIEYLKTRKPGKTTADIEHSYRLIFIMVAIFEIIPVLLALLGFI